MSYNSFAEFYDGLTNNVEYKKRALYFDTILENNNASGGILLDLACGTGSLSFEMEKLGYDVIGVDLSEDMLSEAMAKKTENGSGVLFLNQNMLELDLFGTVKSTICALDSINHLKDEQSVEKAFQNISLFTEPKGILIFDVNTLYKHREILGNNTFIYDTAKCFTAWQNELNEDDSVSMYLDFFKADGDKYTRTGESFTERYYSDEFLKSALKGAGFKILNIYGDLSFHEPEEDEQRKIFVCRKD